jgi:two-component system, OmpR family, aerobic respiration control sensor histidine kinase ArcB
MTRVLLAEDNLAAAMAVKMGLTRLGCEVDHAKNGSEALSMINSSVYNIVFMDVELPDISGLEVTQKIRSLTDSKKSKLPIVALTGYMDKRDVCLAVGMQDALLKPAKLDQLEAMLYRYVLKKTPEKVIDWQGCLQVLDGTESSTWEILQMFAEGLKVSAMILEEAYERTNVKVLRDELHKLRGGICYLKLPQLEKALKEFHSVVRSEVKDQDALSEKYQALKHAMKRFHDACTVREFALD